MSLALEQPPVELSMIDARPPAHGDDDRQGQGQVDEVERVGLVHVLLCLDEFHLKFAACGVGVPLQGVDGDV